MADKKAVVAIYNSHTEAKGIIETSGSGQTATHLAKSERDTDLYLKKSENT